MKVDEIRDMYGKCPMAEIHNAYWSIDIESVDPYNSDDTPLHLACTYADYEAVKILAAMRSNNDFVSTLIDYNADVNITDNAQHTALYYAAESGFTEIVEILIMAGAESN